MLGLFNWQTCAKAVSAAIMWKYIKSVSKSQQSTERDEEEAKAVHEEIRLRKRSKKTNNVYDDETRAKIAKYAIYNGNAKAVSKYGVPESTVRNFKKKVYITNK